MFNKQISAELVEEIMKDISVILVPFIYYSKYK